MLVVLKKYRSYNTTQLAALCDAKILAKGIDYTPLWDENQQTSLMKDSKY